MTSDRVYRGRLTDDEAIAELDALLRHAVRPRDRRRARGRARRRQLRATSLDLRLAERHEPRRGRLERGDDGLPLGEREALRRRGSHLRRQRADAHADAVAERDERTHLAAHVVHRRVGRLRARARPPTGRRRAPTRPSPGRSKRRCRRSRARPRSGRPAPGRAVPCRRFAPVKLATNSSAGAASSSAAAPELQDPSLDDHPDPLGERGRVLEVVRDEQRRQPQLGAAARPARRERPRACARRAPRAARRGGARPGRARARGRARPAGARRRRDRRAARRRGARSGSARAARPRAPRPPKATLRRTSRCGKSAYSWNTSPTERRSGGRSTPRRVSSQVAAPSAIRPRSGRSSPAIARSTLDFPAPDGPDERERLRARARASSERRKERREWSRLEFERVHEGTSLTARRRAALTTTSSAPIASATSKSTSNCS